MTFDERGTVGTRRKRERRKALAKAVRCSLCRRWTREYCGQGACVACHVSIAFKDCVNGTTPDELAWAERKAAAMKERGL